MTKPRAILWTAVSTQAQADDEKASLPAQEGDLKALAARQGWEVVDVLTVPGHSRRYLDFRELIRDALEDDIDAFQRLDLHLKRRDFDVLAVRDADRFARTQTLAAYIVESTINAGAIIYSLNDGEVNQSNYRMFAAMAGFRAAGQVDQLVKYRDMATDNRAAHGLPVSGKAFWSHKIIRNEYGKAVGYVVDETKRPIFDDLAELICSGMGWEDIYREMERRGHADGNLSFTWYRRVLTPTFWGHAARHFGSNYGAWVYDVEAPLPDRVKVWRDVYPAVWTGEVAEEVITELKRRHSGPWGKRYPQQTRRYAGLLVCGHCGRSLNATGGHNQSNGYQCRWVRTGQCEGPTTYINERVIQAHLTPLLKAIKGSADPDAVFTRGQRNDPQAALAASRKELDDVRERARAVAKLYSESVGSPLEDVYRDELRKLEKRAVVLQEAINRAKANASLAAPRKRLIRELEIDALWTRTDHEINQTLHATLGKWRLVVNDGKIAGYMKARRIGRSARRSMDTVHLNPC